MNKETLKKLTTAIERITRNDSESLSASEWELRHVVVSAYWHGNMCEAFEALFKLGLISL